ncbi:MAG: HAMP domain-containing protein [Deltaproteobacteria bacterium]|nr:HAMP domain-containing protein [Deltaproteobacteria bacterium]
MRIRISIFSKLLMFIIPMVCLPVAVVGYSSIKASVERVNRLVRQEQMVQVEAAANKIDDIFYNCRVDLTTISRSPVLAEYHLARLFRLEAEADFNRDNLRKLFEDILDRTPFYSGIRVLNEHGEKLIGVGGPGAVDPLDNQSRELFFGKTAGMRPTDVRFSELIHCRERKGFIVHCSKAFFTGWKEFAGVIVIDVDFERITRFIRSIRVGEEGYSFLIDREGKTLAHPLYGPYKYDARDGPDASLIHLSKDMASGDTGWKEYTFQGQKKVAAFAPIPTMNWSMAVTIPIEEFGKEAQAIRTNVIQLVVVTLLITLVGAFILSYHLLRPVRRLVTATNRLACGDLNQEIPVKSRDELGDLTGSFNRMVNNLSRIQKELVRSEKLISLGRLSAGVAHEIRNPLNAMKGAMVHLGQKWGHEPLIQQYTQLVGEEIDRLDRVVSEFLYFSKQAPPKLEAVDINEIILGTEELLARETQKRGVIFRNLLQPSLPLVRLDTHQMEQVLLNLFFNAMDSLTQGGEIEVGTLVMEIDNEKKLLVVIKDNGTGIRDKNLANVFDPFFTTKEDGTGLGLPLSLGIVEAHGGTIELDSRWGRGTQATIILPLTKNKEDIIT